MKLKKKVLGQINGKDVYKYTLINDSSLEVSLTNLGAQVLSIKVPDTNNKFDDITLHYQDIKNIYENPVFFGAIVARNANRIANAKFNLNGIEYSLDSISDGNNEHSGYDYFHKKICTSNVIENESSIQISFFYHFKDLEQGFPGEAYFTIEYVFNNMNELSITFKMISNKDTIFNPTSHIYWNLAGHKTNNIMEHVLRIYADRYTTLNKNFIPKEIESVVGTAFDFYTKEKCIADDIENSSSQIKLAGGFDPNFVIKDFDKTIKLVSEVYEPTSKRKLSVYSDREGLQFYSGNFIEDIQCGKDGAKYNCRSGFCLETQHFPNAINDANFISPVIRANAEATTTTVFKFSLLDR